LTDDPNRSRFFQALANKMVDIQEAS